MGRARGGYIGNMWLGQCSWVIQLGGLNCSFLDQIDCSVLMLCLDM